MIDRPELECGACYRRQEQSGKIPLCKQAQGCPIEKIAKSLVIHKYCLGFNDYKRLCSADAPDSVRNEALEKTGLKALGYRVLVELEAVYADFVEAAREKDRQNEQRKQRTKQAQQRARKMSGF